MATVLKKGAPSRSYPSRQRKLGPAPFASFEDLSDETPDPSPAVEPLPPITEHSHTPVTATSSYGSGLQTPSTPRIDISYASSSTPPSEDSDKELFQGGLGLAFQEEGTAELRSSTEELELGEEPDSEEERRQRRLEEDPRRASHPANIFCRRKSSTGAAEGDWTRKPSTHTLFLDNLLSRPTVRHASFGSSDYARQGAISSLSAHSSGSFRGRSPSPHKMMLETSFCGSKPIPTKSMDMEEPPPSPPETETEPPPVARSRSPSPTNHRTLSIKSLPPPSPTPTQSSRRPSAASGRRSVSPFKMMLETSFCGSKPIPSRSMEVESPTTTTALVHHSPTTPRSASQSESSPSQSTAKYVSTPNPASALKLHTTNIFKWPDPPPDEPKVEPKQEIEKVVKVKVDDDVEVEVDVKDKVQAVEATFLHQSESWEEDGDLPYVPTTLPQEKPSMPPIAPSSTRHHPHHIPLERPRVAKPPNPATINDYIASSASGGAERVEAKMKISLPREDSQGGGGGVDGRKTSRGSIGATNWTDFAEMGLRSPRELRRKLREENGDD